MLDLDTLAERRAETLNQSKEGWQRAIWNMGFQKLTQSMTDGEVEMFVSYCSSAEHFEAVVRFLEQRCSQIQASPFGVLQDEAARVGTSPEEWVRRFTTT